MNQAYSEVETQRPPRANIPTVLTSFVGREREIDELRGLLASSRLVTLTGAAGCGKTRLAVRVAGAVSRQYADGVYWIELARLADSRLVHQAIAKAVNVVEQPGRPLVDGMLDALHDKQLLLVVDNCEHVLTACSQLAETLLGQTAVSIVATSREPLGVAGEMRYPVSPMALPSTTHSANDIGNFDAIQLFIERARAILPTFELTPDNAGVVASICRQLDGIPLAIELACARVNVLTVEQIASRLDDRFALLATAPHVIHSHHRTLRAAIDWSHDLLSTSEQIVLRRLSVFAGGCSLTTAEAVCVSNGVEREQVLELLSSLVNKSLVMAETLQGSEARYHLLEMIRQYAQEKLIASDEWSATHDRYLQCFLQLTEETAPKLLAQYQQWWFDWLEIEHDNIRVALAWALEQQHIEAGLRIAIALYQFWDRRNYMREGFTWFERLNRHLDDRIPLGVRVNALTFGCFLAMFLDNAPAATVWSQTAVALCETAGEEGKPFLSLALAAAVGAARTVGDAQTAYAISERIIKLERESPDNLKLGMQLYIHGWLAIALGKYDTAHTYLDEAMRYARQDDDPYRIAITLYTMGDLARCEQRSAQARAYYEESLALFRKLGAGRDIPVIERCLAYIALRIGDTQQAHTLFVQSLERQREQDNRLGIVQGLQGFAALAAVVGLPVASVRLHGFVMSYREGITIMKEPTDETDKLDYEYYAALVRAALNDEEFEAEQAKGRALSLQQAVEYALHLPVPALAPTTETDTPSHGLTEREREVVILIGRGLSNGEIADNLVLSKRTVEKHIANILSKLGFTSRAQIVRWAIENGLIEAG